MPTWRDWRRKWFNSEVLKTLWRFVGYVRLRLRQFWGVRRHRYFLFHKPLNALCSTVDNKPPSRRHDKDSDLNPRRTVYECLVDAGFPCDVGLVGRLDNMTSGVMLFCSDAALSSALRNPPRLPAEVANAFKAKVYSLMLLSRPRMHRLHEERSPERLAELCEELSQPFSFVEHGVVRVCSRAKVEPVRCFRDPLYAQNDQPHLGWCFECTVTLSEGKNHQIRRMAARGRYHVVALTRVKIAGILTLESVPEPGSCRWLGDQEVQAIRRGLGMETAVC